MQIAISEYTCHSGSESDTVVIISYSAAQKDQQFAVKTWTTSDNIDDYRIFNAKIQTLYILYYLSAVTLDTQAVTVLHFVDQLLVT